MRVGLTFVLVTLLGALGCSQGHRGAGSEGPGEIADLIVVNARVWTGDDELPEAEAFAVLGGRFVCVGDDRSVRQWSGPKTKTVDARGARIIPGMIDSHLHLISGGLQLARLNLRDVPDRAAFVAAIAERAGQTPAGGWILGGRWSTESWSDPVQPTKGWIDSVTPEHPVLLSRMDGHSALANSVALKLAGIDRDGPVDPAGGKIDRHRETNEPTGILRESAMGLVSRHIPPESPAELDRALAAAMDAAHRYGVTCVHTMSSWSRITAIVAARAEGSLRLRVRCFVSEDDWAAHAERARGFENDDWVRVVGFKQFVDGSLGSRTACMARPFSDNAPDGVDGAARRADWRGLLTGAGAIKGEILRLAQVADAAGLTPAFHAIGDQANRDVLDAYEAVMRDHGPRAGRRLRIEHAQHLLPADVARFGRLGVVASMQPLHKADDGRYAELAIGAERCRTSYAFRSLLDAGAVLAFGSDWPVVSLNPFRGIHAAVTGKTLDGKVFVPEQNISVEQALRAYTTGGAYAAGDDERLGRIRAGHLADFVILEADLLSAAPGSIDAVRVRATYVGGAAVWAK